MQDALNQLTAAQEALDTAIAAIEAASASEVSTVPQWATDVEADLVKDGWIAPIEAPPADAQPTAEDVATEG